MVAATLTAIVVTGAAAILIQGIKIYSTDADQLTTNHDMRKFTQLMASDVASANAFYLFPSFSATPTNNYVSVGGSGEFILLVTSKVNVSDGTNTVTKLTGYYRTVTSGAGTASNTGILYRFSIPTGYPANALAIAGTTDIATMLTNNMTAINAATTVFLTDAQGNTELVAGETSTFALFYNYEGDVNNSQGSAIMVKAQIQTTSGQYQTVSRDTYNLTMNPRG